MPLFAVDAKNSIEPVEQTNFGVERELQRLVEENLGPLFQCRLVLLSQVEKWFMTVRSPIHLRRRSRLMPDACGVARAAGV